MGPAPTIQNLSAQVQALADAGSRESERVGVLEQTTLQLQGVILGLTQRQAAGINGAAAASNSIVGTSVVPEGLAYKTSFKQCRRRCKLAGAKNDRFESLIGWFETQKPTALTIAPEVSGVPGAGMLGQQMYASLFSSTGARTEVHSIADKTRERTR